MSVEWSDNPANGDEPVTDFATLRRLLVGPEQQRLEELSEEIEAHEVTPEELAEKLPEAIALRASRDDQLGRALTPTIETALSESIRRNPGEMATAIFPVLGPAIRKAIAETMAGLVRSINSAVEQSLSVNGLKWRVEAWRTGVPYPEIVIKHALVYRVEQAFLVHAETGLLLEHVSAPDLKVPDADLISSMMSAIQSFVHDSFRPDEGGSLRTFSVGDLTVQVEAGPRALLALVVRGQAPDTLLLKEQDTLETIHLEFASQLVDYNGDATPFEPTRPLLADCLETVLSTSNENERSRFAWMRWGIPLLVVVLTLGALWARSTIRWNRGLDALRAEPGIVVVDASRGLRHWNISGLRDPLARDPRTVITAAGITAPTLSGHWEGYLSLDPALVRARTRQSIDSVARLVERERVLFEAGSSDLNPAGLVAVSEIATLLRQLVTMYGAAGESPHVVLTGRTDETGAEATNNALAAKRVDVVASWMRKAGMDSSMMTLNPVATAKPLVGRNANESARINRSVSLTVTWSPGDRR